MDIMFMALDTFIDSEQSNTTVNYLISLRDWQKVGDARSELSATLCQNSLEALHLTA